jgi:hypothetical protein
MGNYFKGMNIRVNSISPGGIFDNQNPVFPFYFFNKHLKILLLNIFPANFSFLKWHKYCI